MDGLPSTAQAVAGSLPDATHVAVGKKTTKAGLMQDTARAVAGSRPDATQCRGGFEDHESKADVELATIYTS